MVVVVGILLVLAVRHHLGLIKDIEIIHRCCIFITLFLLFLISCMSLLILYCTVYFITLFLFFCALFYSSSTSHIGGANCMD